MFAFIKQMFVITMPFLNFNALNAIPLKWVSINNQECRIRPKIKNVNSNKTLFYPYNIQVNKCISSCNNVNDP